MLSVVGLVILGANNQSALGEDDPLAGDDAAKAAVALLQNAMRPASNREPNLLESLRELRDADMAPLFGTIADSPNRAMRLHGMLGVAASSQPAGLTAARVAGIADAAMQAELIARAIDEDLLADGEARAIAQWRGLDASVRMLLAIHLEKTDQALPDAVIARGLEANGIGAQMLAALILQERGDARGREALRQWSAQLDEGLEPFLLTALRSALRHKLTQAGRFAMALAVDPDASPTLQTFGLSVALSAGDPKAIELWQAKFAEVADQPGPRLRLALLALDHHRSLPAEVYAEMMRDSVPLIAQMGKAANALAGGRDDAGDQIVAMASHNHALANAWALDYAKHHTPPQDASIVALGLILATANDHARTGMPQLVIASQAATVLADADANADVLLHPILAASDTPPQLSQGIILGLIYTDSPASRKLAAQPPRFSDPDLQAFAAWLRARHGLELSPVQRRDLGVLVRGGGGMSLPLRTQAAWDYLAATGLTQRALQQLLDPSRL